MLRDTGRLAVEERAVSVQELRTADEVWLSSSSKEVVPVVAVDGVPVGNGCPSDAWASAQAIFGEHKCSY